MSKCSGKFAKRSLNWSILSRWPFSNDFSIVLRMRYIYISLNRRSAAVIVGLSTLSSLVAYLCNSSGSFSSSKASAPVIVADTRGFAKSSSSPTSLTTFSSSKSESDESDRSRCFSFLCFLCFFDSSLRCFLCFLSFLYFLCFLSIFFDLSSFGIAAAFD